MNDASAYRGRWVSSPRGQSGVVLVTGLILLAVMTLLGLTAMRGSTQGTRMAVNHQHKQHSFQAAENALTCVMHDDPGEVAPPAVPNSVKVNANYPNDELYFRTIDPVEPLDRDRPCWVHQVNGQPILSTDLRVEYLEKRTNLLVSGYRLNSTGYVYQADAQGRVDGTGAQTTNRMGIALIR